MPSSLMTKAGLDELIREKDEIVSVKIPFANEQLHKAREQGDLSENSAYTAAREEREFLNQRLIDLEQMIKNARTISQTISDVIGVGSRVVIDNGKEKIEYTIVGEFESNPLKKLISYKSPLGAALVGKKSGDSVHFESPSGKIQLKIIQVK